MRVRSIILAAVALLAACGPARAHHQQPLDGPTIGVAIPAITHGEMVVVDKYRSRILDLAEREPRTDPTLRRLAGFVSLQHFACFWGLVPGSLTDETSPFNECAHGYVAGARALLAHMVAMPGDQSAAKTLDAQLSADIAADPAAGALCANSSEAFDSGVIVRPDWQLVPSHLPTILTFALSLLLAATGVWGLVRLALATRSPRLQ